MSITLAICCCCSAGVFLTAAALSSDLANLLGENPPEKKSAFSSGSRRSILSSSRGSKTDEERFAAFQDEASGTRAADPQSGKEASALVDELKNANMPADGSWIEPPRVAYSYPQADYLLIPDTRRYCEGSSILSAKAAKSVGRFKLLSVAFTASHFAFCLSVRRMQRTRELLAPPFQNASSSLRASPSASGFRFQQPSRTASCRARAQAGDEWFKGTKAFGWRLLVKGEVLRVVHPQNLSSTNTQDFGAEADVPNRVRQPKAVFCTGPSSCVHAWMHGCMRIVLLRLNAGIAAGTPSEWEQKSGVVTAMRRGLSAVGCSPPSVNVSRVLHVPSF
ncbi:hypothetical protein Efla_002101 [Eimeria flavescens]